MNYAMTTPAAFEVAAKRARARIAKSKAASAERTPEPASPPCSLALAACSLPVSSAEALCTGWLERADEFRKTAKSDRNRCDYVALANNDAAAQMLEACASDLRRELARAIKRQPRENAELSNDRERKTKS